MEENLLDEQICELKKERNALILAHYYVDYGIQQIADLVGDSFELAKKVRNASEEVLIFCGVSFMGESAKILAPDKTVLMPKADAGCGMADTVTPDDIKRLRAENPDAAVVCYVNSSAQTKALCDICCTSSNAEKVVRSLPQRDIIFVPDKNLGAYISKKVPEKNIILFDGCCPIHNSMTREDALAAKQKYPEALFLVHPECKAEVTELADFVGSTSQIIKFAEESDKTEFIIGTENGVVDRLSRVMPKKSFYPLSPKFVCGDMKKPTKQDVIDALLYNANEITLSEELIEKARLPLERMMNV